MFPTNYNASALTDWHKEQLVGLRDEGISCLVKIWTAWALEIHSEDEIFCNATYDGVGCWNYARANTTVVRTCAQIMEEAPDMEVEPGRTIVGNAERICTASGAWLWGNWTNYTECAENFADDDLPKRRSIPQDGRDERVVEAVRYIHFIGSILSLTLLLISLFLFFYFKSLRCDRITVHIHLMTSLCLRFILLIVITEPFIFGREDNYRKVSVVCKTLIAVLLYSMVTSVNWMFIQGHYLHGRLTNNIFDRGTPLKTYCGLGWGLPLILILIWAYVMETYHPKHCWEEFAKQPYIWIIVGPMLFALFVNLLFLINIMRVLLTKIQRSSAITEVVQFRRAVKATLVLFPLLGINNLLFVYNPGGQYEKYYMLANAVLQSSQGMFVSILYCFMSSDVRDAVRREYLRFTIRRSAINSGRSTSRFRRGKSLTTATSVMMMTPRSTPGSGYKQERHDSTVGNNGVGGNGDDEIGFLNHTMEDNHKDKLNNMGDLSGSRLQQQRYVPYSIKYVSKNNGPLSISPSPETNVSKFTCSEQCECEHDNMTKSCKV